MQVSLECLCSLALHYLCLSVFLSRTNDQFLLIIFWLSGGGGKKYLQHASFHAGGREGGGRVYYPYGSGLVGSTSVCAIPAATSTYVSKFLFFCSELEGVRRQHIWVSYCHDF